MTTRPAAFAALALVVAVPCLARAQRVLPRILPRAPFRQITGSIHKQAELIRAAGDYEVDLAFAREIHANAIDQELDNWKKYVEAYWANKQEREKAKLELERLKDLRKHRFLNNKRAQNDKRWARLRDQLGIEGNPANGKDLNFLLKRLSVTLLSYDFAGERRNLPPEAAQQLRIPDAMLHSLRLKQSGMSGSQQLIFRADADAGFELNHWPYLLRAEAFDGLRTSLKQARDAVIREVRAADAVSPDALVRLESALLALTRKFYSQFDAHNSARRGPDVYSQFLAGEVFLQSLHRELRAIQAKGDIRVFPGHVKFDPSDEDQHAITLLTYMVRNGLEFAPAEPNETAAYHRMFQMMRALYLVHAPNDQGIQPQAIAPDGLR